MASTVVNAFRDIRSSVSFTKSFSTNLNEDNTVSYHEHHDQPPQQWTQYHGKIPCLKDAPAASTSADGNTDDGICVAGGQQGEAPRTSMLMELSDRVGVLHDVLRWFWKNDVNICRIESRPHQIHPDGTQSFDFFVDFEGSLADPNVTKLLESLQPLANKVLLLDNKKVHWFPRHISELDLIAGRTLDAGTDLESDHPGFHDVEYRQRREKLTESAMNHRWDKPIQQIHYTPDELAVWGAVWDKMEELWDQYACKEYMHSLELMKTHCGYSRENISTLR